MKYVKIIIFGYLILFAVGFVFLHIFDIGADSLGSLDLASELTWYRAGFYSLVLASWPKLSEWLVKRRTSLKLNDESIIFESEASEKKYFQSVNDECEEETSYFKNLWWKVAIFFAIFEIAAVQKFWI
jgi:hypothetical protein